MAARLDALSSHERQLLAADWRLCAHPGQTAPEGDWTTWLVLGGRGGGKTRVGAEWVADRADARVWAVTDLPVDGGGLGPRVRVL